MRVRLTRDSVCAADDVDVPHRHELFVPDDATISEVMAAVGASGFLPAIWGGKATWSVASQIPLAVIAQQWPEPRVLSSAKLTTMKQLYPADGEFALHLSYHAQEEPDVVFRVLERLHLLGT